MNQPERPIGASHPVPPTSGSHETQMAEKPHKLRRVVGELLLITASILLAFSLEAWWSERSEMRQFEEVMSAVRVEFAGARDELNRARTVHVATAETLASILGLMGPEASPVLGDSLLSLWPQLRFTSTDAPRGVLVSVLARGDISTLPPTELRATLSSWPAELEDHIATERMYEQALEHVRSIASRLSPIPGGAGDLEYASSFPPTPTRILHDFESENAMARALLLLRTVIRENRALGNTVDEVLADLDRVIEDG